MFGLVVGILRMILEFSYSAPACGEKDRRPAVLKDFHYLYFALLLCGLTAIIIVIISFFTEPIPDEKASCVFRMWLLEAIPLLLMPGMPHWVLSCWIRVSPAAKQISFGGHVHWGMNFQAKSNTLSSKLFIVYPL